MDEATLNAEVTRLATGDRDALQRLMVHCHPRLAAVIRQTTDPTLRHRIEPDDVLQQTYVKAFRAVCPAAEEEDDEDPGPPTAAVAGTQFESFAHFQRWLEQVATNALRDTERALRRRKRNPAREVRLAPASADSYPNLLNQLAAGDTTPSHQLAQAEATAAIMSCLARLGDEQREVIRLRFLYDVPFADIARHLGKSENATYIICHRGLKRLRNLLESLTRYLTGL